MEKSKHEPEKQEAPKPALSDVSHPYVPKWFYKGKESKQVNSPEEEKELGPGWSDKPDAGTADYAQAPKPAEGSKA